MDVPVRLVMFLLKKHMTWPRLNWDWIELNLLESNSISIILDCVEDWNNCIAKNQGTLEAPTTITNL